MPLLMLQLRQPDKLSRLVAAHGLLKKLVSGAEKILPKALSLGALQTLWRDVVRSKAARNVGVEINLKHKCERLVLLFWSRRHLHRLEQLDDKHVVNEAQAFMPAIFRLAAGYPSGYPTPKPTTLFTSESRWLLSRQNCTSVTRQLAARRCCCCQRCRHPLATGQSPCSVRMTGSTQLTRSSTRRKNIHGR